MSLPVLEGDALQVFVFGPGVGELVVVRTPPDEWMVVDGCSAETVRYGLSLLKHYKAFPRIVILTHPHMDHAKGLGEVIDYATAKRAFEDWPIIGMVSPPSIDSATKLVDFKAYFDGGVAEEAIATIFDRWERFPKCRADLHRGDLLPLGEAQVRVLSPEPKARDEAFKALKDGRRFNPNQIATVLSVEWKGLRVVLGSDMVEEPGAGWSQALSFDAALPKHVTFKIPHHGSLKALNPNMLKREGADDQPFWVITPYSPKSLTRFSPREGVETLLQHVPRVHLTGLPRSFVDQGKSPATYRLAELQGEHRALLRDPPVNGFPDCMVALTWRAGASAPEVHQGAGSLTVTP